MTASNRLAALDQMPAHELCAEADKLLTALVDIMNHETTLLRAGHLEEAGELSAQKTQMSQDYVVFARSIQRQSARLRVETPDDLEKLRAHHESFATQMAENLRVIASAKTVTESLLSDVAKTMGKSEAPRTYGAAGQVSTSSPALGHGLSVNRAL